MKKMIAFAVVGMCSALLVSGCTNIKELNKALGEASHADEISTEGFGLRITKNKTSQQDVIANIGAPSMTFENESGSTWVYTRVAVRASQSAGNISGNFTAFFPYKSGSFSRGGGIAGVGASASVASQRSSYKTASLTINFNKSGCVVNYEYTATSF